jgi:glycosyltransferase involved in cell wall biosynthesis
MQARIKQALVSGAIDVADSAEAEAHCLPGGTGTVVRCQGSHHFWCATLGQPRRYTRLLLEQIAIRRADGLCAVSQFAADVTRRSMHLGRRPIEILYNPVDTDAFTPDRAGVVLGSVLFVGAITEKKGVRELCASMPSVLQRHPGAQLSLVGRDIPGADGVLLRETIERALAPGIRDRVHFLGARPRSEVSRLMATAHVCVFPSHMETQGIVLVEAMASGRPVVTSLRGPGPEVLGPDGECGLLVDPLNSADIAEKICRVLDDEDAAWRMGQRGRKRAVDHFGVATLISQNLAFYRRHRHRR